MVVKQLPYILSLAGCYLLGAIPFGLLIAKQFYNTDIRKHGSGNPGATNVWRVLGKKPGIITLLLDCLKGLIPILLIKQLFPGNPLLAVGGSLACIAGHNWSIFLMGSGGKGVATSAGVFLALLPVQTSLSLLVFVVVFLATGHVSVGSMVAAVALFSATYLFPTDPLFRILVTVAAMMILIKHIPNMKRLARGKEPKVKFR